MFKDTKEGTTHSYNDGCGEPAHNNPILKAHLEGVKNFEETFCKVGVGGELPNVAYSKPIIAFLTTYGINLLKAARPKMDVYINSFDDPNYDEPLVRLSDVKRLLSAIDEGIKEISK